MANLFGNRNAVALDPRTKAENQYRTTRVNLLLIVIFTLINLGLLFINANSYFLFSASIPYIMVVLGFLFCGKFPEEYYAELGPIEFLDTSVLVILTVIAVVILAVYALCWFFSKNHKIGWMIAALVLFALDTVFLFLYYGIAVDMLLDYLFHAWVLVSLCMGISAHYKLKKLPIEEPVQNDGAADEFADTFNPADFGEAPADQGSQEGTDEQ